MCNLFQSLVPGTRTNNKTKAVTVRRVTPRTISARLLSNLRTKGSRTTEKDMNVYSLNPRSAKIGSKAY